VYALDWRTIFQGWRIGCGLELEVELLFMFVEVEGKLEVGRGDSYDDGQWD
jgi:hypothetical protein